VENGEWSVRTVLVIFGTLVGDTAGYIGDKGFSGTNAFDINTAL